MRCLLALMRALFVFLGASMDRTNRERLDSKTQLKAILKAEWSLALVHYG